MHFHQPSPQEMEQQAEAQRQQIAAAQDDLKSALSTAESATQSRDNALARAAEAEAARDSAEEARVVGPGGFRVFFKGVGVFYFYFLFSNHLRTPSPFIEIPFVLPPPPIACSFVFVCLGFQIIRFMISTLYS